MKRKPQTPLSRRPYSLYTLNEACAWIESLGYRWSSWITTQVAAEKARAELTKSIAQGIDCLAREELEHAYWAAYEARYTTIPRGRVRRFVRWTSLPKKAAHIASPRAQKHEGCAHKWHIWEAAKIPYCVSVLSDISGGLPRGQPKQVHQCCLACGLSREETEHIPACVPEPSWRERRERVYAADMLEFDTKRRSVSSTLLREYRPMLTGASSAIGRVPGKIPR